MPLDSTGTVASVSKMGQRQLLLPRGPEFDYGSLVWMAILGVNS